MFGFLTSPFWQALAMFLATAASGAPAAPPLVAYEDLLREPELYLGREIRLVVSTAELVTEWEPYLTRFAPDDYVGLRAWSDAQLPWVEADYNDPKVRVFARSGSPAARDFARMGAHDRLLLWCLPREFMVGELWIEVDTVFKKKRFIPEGSVLHALKAKEFEAMQAWGLAAAELDRALAAPLPAHAAQVLEEQRARFTQLAKRRDARSIPLPEAREAARKKTGSEKESPPAETGTGEQQREGKR